MCARGQRGPVAVGTIHDLARETWGVEVQVRALGEELCEAAAAAMRVLNGKASFADLREELVDVEALRLSIEDVLGTQEEWEADRERKRAKLGAKLGVETESRFAIEERS